MILSSIYEQMNDPATDLGHDYDKLFDKSGNQGESWHEVQVTWDKYEANVYESRRLIIEATLVPNFQGEIALADIRLDPGACKEEGE